MEFSSQHPHIRQFTPACNQLQGISYPLLLPTDNWLPWTHTPTHRHTCINITIVSSYYKTFPWWLFVRILSYLICNTRVSLVVVWAHSSRKIRILHFITFQFSYEYHFLVAGPVFQYFFSFLGFREFLYICILSQNSFGEYPWLSCITTSPI